MSASDAGMLRVAGILPGTLPPTATVSGDPMLTPTPTPIIGAPEVDSDNCKLMGPFALFVQAIMGILVIASLVYKRQREKPKRKWKIWALDVSKQLLGQLFVHILNIILSDFVASGGGENPCSLYFLNILVDTTLGVFFIYIALKFVTWFLTQRLGLQGFVSGQYTPPLPTAEPATGSSTTWSQQSRASHTSYPRGRPRVRYWLKQLGSYLFVLFLMKMAVLVILAVFPFLYDVGSWILGLFGSHKDFQVLFSMALFPLAMNILQFWLIDSLLRHNPYTSAYSKMNPDDEQFFNSSDRFSESRPSLDGNDRKHSIGEANDDEADDHKKRHIQPHASGSNDSRRRHSNSSKHRPYRLQTMTCQGPPLGRSDYSRWRLRVSDGGRHVWHYLRDDAECKAWPQSIQDKYWLGLPTDLPQLPRAKIPLDAAKNGLSFYRNLQSSDGHWAGEYGGPMFLLPGIVIGMYVTKTPIPEEWRIEIARYLWHRANKDDGGWGIHIEASSTVFGTALNYTLLRLIRVSADHPMMVKARGTLHKLGGATGIPSWGKLWLAILNCYEWEGMNPIPPELWLLPDWLPIHPWRWWIHTRMVYIPMGYLWGRRFKAEMDPLIASLREELYVQPYESIDWPSQRGNIAQVDTFYPHTKTLKTLMALVGAYDHCHIPALRKAGIQRAYDLLVLEDENTSYQCLGPVNKMLNYIARWDVQGHDSHAMRMHREKLKDFMWIGAEGMMMTGTNGSQLWDTAFIAQAMVDSGLAASPENKQLTQKLLDWLDDCQIRSNPQHHKTCYRFATKGAWPFSTKEQGYVVSDCTGEGLKAVIMLQENVAYLGKQVSRERMHDSIDLLLTMQNSGGGFASYERINGPAMLELINPAEVFGDIMIEYAYPECTTSVVTALLKFTKIDDYRKQDIKSTVHSAVKYILKAQRKDGSWFGSWAICFTYATMFAVESLMLAGHTYENSDAIRKACEFLESKQMLDGGWGETYESCVKGVYTHAAKSQVVQTAWVVITLLHAKYPKKDRIKKAVKVIMDRQLSDGSWAQEQIEGIFNRNCAISYPNYKFSFTIWALGKAARELDWN